MPKQQPDIPANHNLNIAIAGAGGLGSLFGGRLFNHAQVTLIARGKRLQQLRNDGVVIHINDNREINSPRLIDSEDPEQLSALTSIDYLLFACKSQHTAELAKILAPMTGPETEVVSLQNGVDNETVLAEHFDRSVIGAMTVQFGSHLNAAGEVDVVGELITRLGDYPTGLSPRLDGLVKLLNRAGFVASTADDIRLESWKKMIINCACNPVSALLLDDIQTLYKAAPSRWIMQNMMREAAAAAAADGVSITPADLEQLSGLLAGMPPLKSSMQVDAERGTPLELGGLTGAILHRSANLGLEALVTATVHQLLLARYPNAAV